MLFSQLAAALTLKSFVTVTDQLPIITTINSHQSFSWDQTTPHTHLQWTKCFKDFKCARLQVPMDWHHNTSEAHKTVELAVIKLEATVPVTDATYGGLVFFNPGGPGGSGVKQILQDGHSYRTILSAGPDSDPAIARHFDIISFDPRGINNTTPGLSCFPTHLDSTTWHLEKHAEGYIGDAATSFDNLWARMRGLAEGCSERAAREGIAKHMSTAPVARDILELFERHGQWREAEAQRLVRKSSILSATERAEILRRTAYKKGQEMIQYWGFSYGSILGAHVAAMFPDRVLRLVIDGVCDSPDYMAGGWTTNLQDTDVAFSKLVEYCWVGGEQHCPLWHKDGTAVITDQILSILAAFKQNPISRPGNATHGSVMVNYHDYEVLIRDGVYNLLMALPVIVQVIHELGQGVAPTLQAWKASQLPSVGTPLSQACLRDGPYSAACQKSSGSTTWDAIYGIACSDGLPRTTQTKDEFREYANMLINQSSLIGSSWAEIQMPCTAWNARPAWRYTGDFVAKTAHPILLIGNSYDPVTPLRNAFTMAKGFDNARVLHQNSEGHCSPASPSMCTGKAIRRYFQTGELPSLALRDDHAYCEPDLLPLQGYVQGSRPDLPGSESDAALWASLLNLNQAWP